MNNELFREIQRLTVNAARRREDLQVTGLRKAKRKKALTILAGILALTSAGTITTVISNVWGNIGIQLAAALTAAVSGTVSLFITAYYSDDAVFSMLLGSTKYLTLRENVYRLVIHPNMSDADRFTRLEEFQAEYGRLDEIYSRYFSVGEGHFRSTAPPLRSADRAVVESVDAAERQERENLEREIRKSEALSDAS
jgi:hypothetical protein